MRATPGAAREIHEAAVRYYENLPPRSPQLDELARREELYHRLMLKQPRHELDRRWASSAGEELAAVMDEFPAESQLYLAGQIKGLRLDPEVRAEADDEQWRHSVRPSVESLLERRQFKEALERLRERRGRHGQVLLPDLEIEALERLGRLEEALRLAKVEQKRVSALGQDVEVRELIVQEALILERMRRFGEAWRLLARLADMDRTARTRRPGLDEELVTRELVVLTSMLRIARHALRDDTAVQQLRSTTADLADEAPSRVLTRNPSLLRDLAAELGDASPRVLRLATEVRGVEVGQRADPANPSDEGHFVSAETFAREADKSLGYIGSYTVKTYRTMRIAIVMLLQALMIAVIIEWSGTNRGCFENSISAYYYTPAQTILVGTLIAVAVLMVVLKGGSEWENILLNVGGMLLTVVALVPTSATSSCSSVADARIDVAANVANSIPTILITGILGFGNRISHRRSLRGPWLSAHSQLWPRPHGAPRGIRLVCCRSRLIHRERALRCRIPPVGLRHLCGCLERPGPRLGKSRAADPHVHLAQPLWRHRGADGRAAAGDVAGVKLHRMGARGAVDRGHRVAAVRWILGALDPGFVEPGRP